MSTALTEAIQASDAAAKAAREFYSAHSTEEIAESADLLEQSKQHNRKMADLSAKAADLQMIENGRNESGKERESAGRATSPEQPAAKAQFDAEQAWANSEGLAAIKSRGVSRFSGTVELVEYPLEAVKATLTLSNLTPQSQRLPLRASAQDETTVGDLMLQGTTDSNVISYYEETTFTNAAATVAEEGSKPESALAFTERTDTVRKIATWIPATSEFLEDNAGIRSYVEGRLRFMVEREEEDQLLNGDGTAPNISGILDRSGIQTVTSTNDIEAIYRAMTEVRVDGQAEPTAVVIHPLSWQNIRLGKDDNNQYYGPGPFAADDAETLWGLRVRVTPLIAEGTALVGAFRPFAQVFRKGGIRVVASTEHSDFFVKNKVAILAEERLALSVYRPAAFCSVSGLASS